MQLVFKFYDWQIFPTQGIVGRQYDNLSHILVVEGELPSGYTWDMLVEAKGKYNIIPLSATATGATASLTADQLAFGDTYYAFQLRGTSGEVIHHTNAVQVYVPDTIVGPGTWPVLPTEFSQAEANIKELNAHPPVPGENGYWMLWDLDTHSYVQSQLVVPGLHIEIGETTTGDPGTPASVTNSGTNTVPVLNFTIPEGEKGDTATIQVGTVAASDPGSEPQVKNSGTENAAVFDFVLPRGNTGPTGQAATIEVESTVTGEPGTQASVENVGTTGAAKLKFTIPRGNTGQNGVQLNDNAVNTTEAWSSKKIVDTLCPAFSVSGNPVTCNPVENYPLDVSLSFTPKQEGTGDPSPDNVRPITGYDSLSLTRCGKNLLDCSLIQTGTSNGITLAYDEVTQTFTMSGQALASRNYFDTYIPLIPVNENVTLTVIKTGGDISIPEGKVALAYFGAGDKYGASENIPLNTSLEGTSKTTSDFHNKKYLTKFWFYLNSEVVVNDLKFKIQLELGSSATNYEPYQGETYDIAFPETVYGGTVDVVAGVGEKTWGYIASYNGESLPGEWISDRDVYSSGTTPTTGAQVAYKLATPEPFQATGNQPLPAVAGLNTVYTDGDSLDVTGRQDLLYTLQTMQAQTQNLNRFIAEGGTQ